MDMDHKQKTIQRVTHDVSVKDALEVYEKQNDVIVEGLVVETF